METKTALITGITGQDGWYLSRLLSEKGYEVHGLVRKVVGRQELNLPGDPIIHQGDIRSHSDMSRLLIDVRFDEIYHLAAQSDVAYSFQHPQDTYETNITGTLNVINAVKELADRAFLQPKLYFAGTSELYGKPESKPQDENYPFKPVSPYAVSKLAGFYTAQTYRKAYDMFISSGILFNHESPMRGENFVTQKIVKGIGRFLKDGTPFQLGNLDALKDWGHAEDYVRGMWMMLQAEKPDDYVLATNEQYSVRDFVEATLEAYDVDYVHVLPTLDDGYGVTVNFEDAWYINHERAININRKFYRPNEADNYMGDYSKARNELGWKPNYTFNQLVKDMVTAEKARLNL